MKVLLITTHLNLGGISVYTINLARHLKKKKIEVTVVSSGGTMEYKLEQANIPHVTMDIKTKAEFGIKMWKALPVLIKLVKNGDFDVIHAQTRVAHVLGRLTGLRTGVPLVTTCHGFYKYHRLGRRLFPCWGRKVIAISKSVRKHLIEDFHMDENRVSQIYNGIDLDPYLDFKAGPDDSGLKKRIGMHENAFLVGTLARLSPVKGHNFLIDAFKEAKKERPSMQLLIVGEGKEESRLKEQVREAGLSSDVFFVGGIDRSLEKYFYLMNIFCLVSLSEGFGLSLIEAMASGRACVTSNMEGPAEIITDEKDGILVPPGDAEALSKTILRLEKDDRLRENLGKAARERARDNFAIERTVEKTIEVYKQVLGIR